MATTKRINLISSPRNLSTALMYSFAQRADTKVVDEPLYAYYLSCTDIDHPGRAAVLSSQSQNSQEVVQKIIFGNYVEPILFIKNMTSHIKEMDEGFLEQLWNIIYIRNPKQIIASYAQVVEMPQASEIATIRQYELFEQLRSKGKQPIVLDSSALLVNPRLALQKLCTACEIPFYEEMLTWDAGPIPEDGVWAKYWYANVHQTTGFKKQKTSDRVLPPHLIPLYEELKPYYDKMYAHAIRVE
ncbi:MULTISPECIES: hypothetical protein [unclassified Aureispira]|uniref:sulfotransferase-like domain-containing protein n=1 Tax=unclassified Aureispira TaxID=2649989 RepID=UPI0006976352|nr:MULTISPECIES: hypothetical protein [unclassified Aureispira]WMX15506.1 hypothetical protein QP953_03835 [Aureispira sp. CCB-E]